MYCRWNFDKILNFGASTPTHLSSVVAKFGMQELNHCVLFITKLRLDRSILSALLGKNHSNIAIFTKFWNLGAPVLLFTIRTIFGLPDGALFHAKLRLHQCVVAGDEQVLKYCDFDQTSGALIPTPSPIITKFGMQDCIRGLLGHATFGLGWYPLSPVMAC